MRSVLITGTSSGIGQATAVALAMRDWRVFATMRDIKKRGLLDQALMDVAVQNSVEVVQLDVATGASIHAATDAILFRTGNKLDAVVHNAGVAAAGALEDVPEAEVRRVMETNFFGVVELTRALLPTFREQGERPNRHRVERGCVHGAADQFDLAHRNGRSKDGPSLLPTSLSRSDWMSFS